MSERKDNGSDFKLTVEEASAVMAIGSRAEITPYMKSLLDSVEQRACAIGYNSARVVAMAALTDGVLVCLSFGENLFNKTV
jgi:hypothetical protein